MDTSATQLYTLSLHDALPIYQRERERRRHPEQPRQADARVVVVGAGGRLPGHGRPKPAEPSTARPEGPVTSEDRKSTRLNSSHVRSSYAVFCLKKKKNRVNTQ